MLVHIDYELTFAAPFHFGTGVTAGLIDRTVIRSAGGDLYVPASTFKGVLREHCEHLCRFYLPDEPIASPHDAYAALTQFGKSPTLISRIFGSQLHPGGLRFDDARQIEEIRRKYGDVQTSDATQVRIDRLTRTAVDEALYTSEFGNHYLVFKGTIKGLLNCTPVGKLARPTPDGCDESVPTPTSNEGDESIPTPTYSLLLLLAGMLMIERLGGNKSTGKGQCLCTIKRVWLDRRNCSEEQWQAWIAQLAVLKDYARNEKGGQA